MVCAHHFPNSGSGLRLATLSPPREVPHTQGCPDDATPPASATRRRESVEVAQPSRREGRLEFTPQAGQPNGNKKLRQTVLPTPRRPVNITNANDKAGG